MFISQFFNYKRFNMKFIIGKKIGMTQLWQEENVVAVTKVKTDPCFVTQVKKQDKDGYFGVQIGTGEKKEKNIKKPQKGHFKKVNNKNLRHLKEFRLDKNNESAEMDIKEGDKIDINTFEKGDKIKISGISKGRGFQGVVKRHGFSGASKTHGTKDQVRMPGSIGSIEPGRVFKGKRMPGRMGGAKITTANLEIVDIDSENNFLFIKGSVAGANGGLVFIKGEGELRTSREEEKTENKEKGKTEDKEENKEAKEENKDKSEEKNEETNK